MTLNANETVFCRFTGEALTVIGFDGAAVVTVRDGHGNVHHRIVGELTRRNGHPVRAA